MRSGCRYREMSWSSKFLTVRLADGQEELSKERKALSQESQAGERSLPWREQDVEVTDSTLSAVNARALCCPVAYFCHSES
ncbi:hypothetical protein STEG23_025181 [Scotinomys teguina]